MRKPSLIQVLVLISLNIHRNFHSCFDKALFFKLYVCLYACAPIYRMILKLRVVMTQGWLEKYKTSKFHKLKKEISQNASFVHSKNFPRTRRANKGREYLLEYVVWYLKRILQLAFDDSWMSAKTIDLSRNKFKVLFENLGHFGVG